MYSRTSAANSFVSSSESSSSSSQQATGTTTTRQSRPPQQQQHSSQHQLETSNKLAQLPRDASLSHHQSQLAPQPFSPKSSSSSSSSNAHLMPDLSHLSEAERQIIEAVFARQRAEEELDSKLVQLNPTTTKTTSYRLISKN